MNYSLIHYVQKYRVKLSDNATIKSQSDNITVQFLITLP